MEGGDSYVIRGPEHHSLFRSLMWMGNARKAPTKHFTGVSVFWKQHFTIQKKTKPAFREEF